MRIFSVFILMFATFQAMASGALAPRAGVGGKIDMFGCMQTNDYYIANFAAYQGVEKAKENKQPIVAQCTDLSLTGKTQISVDLLDRDVRRKPVWLKVFDKDKNLLTETLPTIQKQGVITTSVNFVKQGKYDVVLYVEDGDLNVNPEESALHIPLNVVVLPVGQAATGSSFLKVAIVVLVLAGLTGFGVTRLLKPETATA